MKLKNYKLAKILFLMLVIFVILTFVFQNSNFILINQINHSHSNYYSDSDALLLYKSDDTTPPVIDFLQHHPQNPEWYEDINITVEVYDDNSGIKYVILSYSSNLDEYGGYRNITMTHLKDDTYNCTIPHSIYVKNNGYGDIVKYKVYASDQAGNWAVSPEQSYYLNDTIPPHIYIYSPLNDSWVSSVVKFNVSSLDNGSGIGLVNLTIYNQNGSIIESFTSTEESNIFEWDTSSLPNYNKSNPQYYIVNYTVKDNSVPQNSNSTTIILYLDKELPYISYINKLPCQELSTITNISIKGSIIENSTIRDTWYNDSKNYLSILNSSSGIITMPLSVNLSDFGINYDLIELINITISAKINLSNNNIIQAGWGIFNWSNNSIYIIDNSIFNTSYDQFSNFEINTENLTNFVLKQNNSRIEIFVLLNTTGQDVSMDVNFINFHIIYNQSYWFSGENFTISIWGNDSISYQRMLVHYENITLFEINTSYLGPCTIDTSKIPSGKSIPVNLTTYDKAGNILSDIIYIQNDHDGPYVSINSPKMNNTFGQSGIWNTIVPINISGHENISEFKKMELYINGQIQPVYDGQLGQIIETNATGYVIYRQTNSTWYKEGNYIYYWNASLIPENTTVNITLIGYDKFNNTNSTYIIIKKCIFIENISVEISTLDYIYEETPFILEVIIKNYGNATLYNYTPILILPNNWKYTLYQYSSEMALYLDPEAQQTIKYYITPSTVSKTTSITFYINIECKIVENFTQNTNNYSVSFNFTLQINPKTLYMSNQYLIPLYISIFTGIGVCALLILIYYQVKIKEKGTSLKA